MMRAYKNNSVNFLGEKINMAWKKKQTLFLHFIHMQYLQQHCPQLHADVRLIFKAGSHMMIYIYNFIAQYLACDLGHTNPWLYLKCLCWGRGCQGTQELFYLHCVKSGCNYSHDRYEGCKLCRESKMFY